MAQLTIRVATAQPASPSAGTPAPPKASQIDSGTFTTSAPSCIQVTK